VYILLVRTHILTCGGLRRGEDEGDGDEKREENWRRRSNSVLQDIFCHIQ